MYKLLNRTDFFNSDEIEKDMQYYISKYGFDGFELIKFTDVDNTYLKIILKVIICVSFHLGWSYTMKI